MSQNSVLDWLLDGDPAIRWQTMRDLLDLSPEECWQERQRIPQEGWGARYVGALQPDGFWPNGRWTETVWTLLVLIDMGFPPDFDSVRGAAHLFLEKHLTHERAGDARWLLQRVDLCHLGFWLRIGAYFGFDPERLRPLAQVIQQTQMADGGWNCRVRNYPRTTHSSFHTTFNLLEGLALAAEAGLVGEGEFRSAEARALEFMLAHRMYRSDRTGDIIDAHFTYLTFPSHWHYTVLRGLDYMRAGAQMGDARLADSLALIDGRRQANGRWIVEKPIAGKSLFPMERMGVDSRWNTLRSLRVLSARQRQGETI